MKGKVTMTRKKSRSRRGGKIEEEEGERGMRRQSKTTQGEERRERVRGIGLHPIRMRSSSPSSLYTARRAAMPETTCDEEKNKNTESENVQAQAEGDERREEGCIERRKDSDRTQ